MRSLKFLFYIGYSKSGTTFFKNQVLKRSTNHKYLNFEDYFEENIFFDRKKMDKYCKSEKFRSFKKIVNKSDRIIVIHKNLINPIRVFRNTNRYDVRQLVMNLSIFDKKIENKMLVLISTRRQDELIISYYNEFFDYFYLNNNIQNIKDFYKFILETKLINFFFYQKIFSILKKNKIKFVNFDYDNFFKYRDINKILKICNINEELKVDFKKKYKSGVKGIYYVSSSHKLHKIIYSIFIKFEKTIILNFLTGLIKKINNKNLLQIKKSINNYFKKNR